jgi:hypothetical protein
MPHHSAAAPAYSSQTSPVHSHPPLLHSWAHTTTAALPIHLCCPVVPTASCWPTIAPQLSANLACHLHLYHLTLLLPPP